VKKSLNIKSTAKQFYEDFLDELSGRSDDEIRDLVSEYVDLYLYTGEEQS